MSRYYLSEIIIYRIDIHFETKGGGRRRRRSWRGKNRSELGRMRKRLAKIQSRLYRE